MLWIGLVLGIVVVIPETAGLYGVSAIFLILISENVPWLLKQLIAFESTIVSVERVFAITSLKP